MKLYKVVFGTKEEWLKPNENLHVIHFTNEQLAEKQLKNAEENGMKGYIATYNILNDIINLQYIKQNETTQDQH